jgi:hypothetical protein
MKAAILVVLALAAGCYSPNLGESPFACGSAAPVCPDGYDCMSGQCVKSGGNVTAPDASGSGGCPDAVTEPNNSYTSPFVTPVTSGGFKTYKLTGLAICPAGDVDYYEFNTNAANQMVTATITYGSSGSPLDLQILNSNGMNIKNGTGSGNSSSASVANLETDATYFVFVEASMSGGANSYSLEIDVSP